MQEMLIPVGRLCLDGQTEVLLCLNVVLCHHVSLRPPEQSLHIVWILFQHLHHSSIDVVRIQKWRCMSAELGTCRTSPLSIVRLGPECDHDSS